jgi:peptide deformylase
MPRKKRRKQMDKSSDTLPEIKPWDGTRDKIVTDRKILKIVSRETTWEEVKELKLKERLKDALKAAWVPGNGLAAIQIGIPVRYAFFFIGGREYELINPKIISAGSGRFKLKNEGCLSVPNTWSSVLRAYKIRYENDGVIKTARSQLAHIIQHEVDHMAGTVNVDKATRSWPVAIRK